MAFHALALTCRGLSDPALDWLWAGLPNVAPLLHLFPLEPIPTPDDPNSTTAGKKSSGKYSYFYYDEGVR